jgi:cytoskeletal protein CcmA (bactofilin family)
MSLFGTKHQDTFSDMSESRPVSPQTQAAGTLIAHGVRVEGDFSSQGDVQIEGEVHGAVKITGRLSAGPQAMLKADVSAERAKIAGTVEGNVSVVTHLELTSTARVNGDIVCETIAVESGATLNGKVMIGPKGNAKAGKAEAKESKAG